MLPRMIVYNFIPFISGYSVNIVIHCLFLNLIIKLSDNSRVHHLFNHSQTQTKSTFLAHPAMKGTGTSETGILVNNVAICRLTIRCC